MCKIFNSAIRLCSSKPEESHFRPEDLVVLLVGPIGSKVEEFVEEVTGHACDDYQQTLIVPSKPEIKIETVIINGTGGQRRITFLIPTLFDGNKITEGSILEQVDKWLRGRKNGSKKPNIDRILYFSDPEEEYQIPLTWVCVYWPSLQKVCGTESKIALVISTDRRDSDVRSKVPKEWSFLSGQGAKVFAFNKGSATDVIGQIIYGF